MEEEVESENSRGGAVIKLRVTTYAPSQVLPLVLHKPIKRATLEVESRKGRFIQCGHIGQTDGVPRKPHV